MTIEASDLKIRVSDQQNGVYRIESVEWCSGERGGVALGHSDFIEDVVSCALARLGTTGDASLWAGAVTILDDFITVIAWIA